jgi:hypothetical protein
MANDPLTTGQKVGIAIFLLPHLLASIGHSWDVHPASAPEWYFVLLAVSGLIGGILLGVDCRIGGALGGPVATFGAMFAVAAYLSQVEVAYSALVVIFGGLGALPGYGLYQLVKTVFFSSADVAPGTKRIVLVSDEAHQVEPVKATVVEGNRANCFSS